MWIFGWQSSPPAHAWGCGWSPVASEPVRDLDLIANSWMQSPVGYEMKGRAVLTDFAAVVSSPGSALLEVGHVTLRRLHSRRGSS